jgi:hypothetical protein
MATISTTGTLEPEAGVDVGTQVAGVIIAFGKDKHGKDINWGLVVDAGMVLAKIDNSLYAAVIITLGIVPALLIWCSIGMKG